MRRILHIIGAIIAHIAPLVLAVCVLRFLGFVWWQTILLSILVTSGFWIFVWALAEVNELEDG